MNLRSILLEARLKNWPVKTPAFCLRLKNMDEWVSNISSNISEQLHDSRSVQWKEEAGITLGPERGHRILTFAVLPDIMYDMSVIARDFLKRFSHFKRQAMAGVPVKLKDRDGRSFVFKLEKTSGHCGAGRDLSKGVPLSPAPIDGSEWKDLT